MLNIDILYNKLVFIFLFPENDDNNIERDILVSFYINHFPEKSRIYRIYNNIKDLFENKWIKKCKYYEKFEYIIIINDLVI